jgi:Holliday junction resolvase-like predicted endonuclease
MRNIEKTACTTGHRIIPSADLPRLTQKLDETITGISDNIGHHTEQYFQHVLENKLTFGGEKYDKLLRNFKYEGKESCEFDILMVNGKSVALIEVKSRIHPKFVKKMAEEKVAQFRKFFPEYKDYKLYLGIAGFSFAPCVVEDAKKYGVGILRQVGDSVEMDDNILKVY